MTGLLQFVVACAGHPPQDWRAVGFDALRDSIPPAERSIRGVPIGDDDYRTLLWLGEQWFRDGEFGSERTITDVLGVFLATVTVPCGDTEDDECEKSVAVMPVVLRAIDALDGVVGNLFEGNGGPQGNGFTSDLVLRFPPETRLFGTIPVPEALHTGLDVEAGATLPIGIGLVPAPPEDQALGYLPDFSTFGYAAAPAGKVRLRLACAACHYSLDIDNDGTADLRSAQPGTPTTGSPYEPWDAWGVGNHDISFGWLFALSANPLLGTTVISGDPGHLGSEGAVAFVRWIVDRYREEPEAVAREVVAGMLVQPPGYADVTTDAVFDTIQFPTLYTRHAWPANSDGAQSNGTDRNNTVWTGALDFTGLIGQCAERASRLSGKRPKKVYDLLPCAEFADLMTRYSPSVRYDPSRQQALVDDILGKSDGVPGLLDPDSVVVMKSLALPKEILKSPLNDGRRRVPSDFGGDAHLRGFGMALLGVRIAVAPAYRQQIADLAQRYGLDAEDLMSEAVSLVLDWMDPPSNTTALLAGAVDQVSIGYEVFRASGCEQCHRGPFGTDNVIHALSSEPDVQFGAPRAPSTAGWRVLDRGIPPYLGTEPHRTQASRAIRRFASAPYDPVTGAAIRPAGLLPGIVRTTGIGYKTTALRYLWGSAPYLHDGGVAVALRPDAAVPDDDLATLLRRAGDDALYGMGAILTPEDHQGTGTALRANAALSLQALVLVSERAKVIAANESATYVVWPGSADADGTAAPDRLSMRDVGVHGVGHEFWVDDVPGGPKVTALVAYLLAFDDCPRNLPGRPNPCESGPPWFAP